MHIVKAMVFPVVTYKCESWIIKNAECRRIEAFELWCWKRLFGEPLGQQGDQTHQTYWKWTLNIHWKVWCWSRSSNTLTTWCKEPNHWEKKLWCWERLNSGEEGGGGGLDSWMASLTQWTWVWANSGHSEGQGSLACCSPWGAKSWTWFSAWTTLCTIENSTQCSVVT